jgi:hypothetical protein
MVAILLPISGPLITIDSIANKSDEKRARPFRRIARNCIQCVNAIAQFCVCMILSDLDQAFYASQTPTPNIVSKVIIIRLR